MPAIITEFMSSTIDQPSDLNGAEGNKLPRRLQDILSSPNVELSSSAQRLLEGVEDVNKKFNEITDYYLLRPGDEILILGIDLENGTPSFEIAAGIVKDVFDSLVSRNPDQLWTTTAAYRMSLIFVPTLKVSMNIRDRNENARIFRFLGHFDISFQVNILQSDNIKIFRKKEF